MKVISKKNEKNLVDEYHKNVVNTWSFKAYEKYKDAPWRFADLPFADFITEKKYLTKEYLNWTVTKKIENKSVLEIGSAMGAAYKFLKKSKLFDQSEYTGIEVSKTGHDYCVKNYPETNWIHQDFTKIKKLQKYDYVFERNAIHHMPEPLNAYKKLFKITNISLSTCFRSCLRGQTISDLEVGNFKNEGGTFYASIINIFDLIELAIEEGFGNFKITFGGRHETISNDPLDNFYLSPNVDQEEVFLSRCKIRMIKTKFEKKPTITFIARPDVILKNLRAVALIYAELRRIENSYTK